MRFIPTNIPFYRCTKDSIFVQKPHHKTSLTDNNVLTVLDFSAIIEKFILSDYALNLPIHP